MFISNVVVLVFIFKACDGHNIHGQNDVKISADQQKNKTQNGTMLIDLQLNLTSLHPKINLCCKPNEIYHESKCSKDLLNTSNEIIFPTIKTNEMEESYISPWTHFDVQVKNPCKKISYLLDQNSPNNILYLLENGTVVADVFSLPLDAFVWKFKNEDYCLARIIGAKEISMGVVVCQLQYKSNDFLRCIWKTIYCISILALVATFGIYVFLSEHKNVRGFIFMTYVVCYFFSQIGFSMDIARRENILIASSKLCNTIGFMTFFFSLAKFFWLNVMCFDIWQTFRFVRGPQDRMQQLKREKLISYSCYAWGCSLIFICISITLETLDGTSDSFLKPQIGKYSCWFGNRYAEIVFLGVPASLILVCNVYLFILTARKIFKQTREIAHHTNGKDSQRHDDRKHWFYVYLNLFVVMGMNWCFTISCYLFWYIIPEIVLYISVLIHSTQGIVIFIVFVWNKQTKRLLFKRIGWKNKDSQSKPSIRSDGSGPMNVVSIIS